jgi:hypothetical protein
MVAIYPIDWHMPDLKRVYAAVAVIIALALLITFSTVPIPSGTAGIAGQVLDQQGRPVSYATVVAREVIRAQVIRADAQADGSYTLTGVRPGTYTLLAGAYGYKTKPLGKITVSAGRQVRLEVVLER